MGNHFPQKNWSLSFRLVNLPFTDIFTNTLFHVNSVINVLINPTIYIGLGIAHQINYSNLFLNKSNFLKLKFFSNTIYQNYNLSNLNILKYLVLKHFLMGLGAKSIQKSNTLSQLGVGMDKATFADGSNNLPTFSNKLTRQYLKILPFANVSTRTTVDSLIYSKKTQWTTKSDKYTPAISKNFSSEKNFFFNKVNYQVNFILSSNTYNFYFDKKNKKRTLLITPLPYYSLDRTYIAAALHKTENLNVSSSSLGFFLHQKSLFFQKEQACLSGIFTKNFLKWSNYFTNYKNKTLLSNFSNYKFRNSINLKNKQTNSLKNVNLKLLIKIALNNKKTKNKQFSRLVIKKKHTSLGSLASLIHYSEFKSTQPVFELVKVGDYSNFLSEQLFTAKKNLKSPFKKKKKDYRLKKSFVKLLNKTPNTFKRFFKKGGRQRRSNTNSLTGLNLLGAPSPNLNSVSVKINLFLVNKALFKNKWNSKKTNLVTKDFSKYFFRKNFLANHNLVNNFLSIYDLCLKLDSPFLFKVNFSSYKNNNLYNIFRRITTVLLQKVNKTFVIATNMFPSPAFNFLITKKVYKSQMDRSGKESFIPWYYNTIVRFLENISGSKILFQFYPFMHKNVDLFYQARYEKWIPRMGYYEKKLGHKFFMKEALHIMHLSFHLKDPRVFSSWLKAIILRISFWKTRFIFRFLKYLMQHYFFYTFPDLKIKGLKIRLKGKISAAGNSRKRVVLYCTGQTSHSSVVLRVLHEFATINTFTGVMGFQVWLFY